MKNNPIASNKKLLNSYGWGGYLLWIWPEKNIFIDGKMPQRLLHNDITFLEEYDSFFKQDSFSKKLDQHAIQVVMLPIQKNFSFNSVKEKRLYKLIFSLEENDFQKEPYLLNYLDQHWIKLFEDEIAVIYLRPVNN